MKTVASGMSLFFRLTRDQLTGLIATYVDDTLDAGNRCFDKDSEKTRGHFEVNERERNKMRFAGIYVYKSNHGYRVHQTPYLEILKPLALDADFTQLRRAKATLSWLLHT